MIPKCGFARGINHVFLWRWRCGRYSSEFSSLTVWMTLNFAGKQMLFYICAGVPKLPIVRRPFELSEKRNHWHSTRSITLVGATQGIPETAATFSAGGFSNLFPQESWRTLSLYVFLFHSSNNSPETNAVNEYLSQIGNQYNGRFNRAGRGYPDVSTAGYNVEIFHQGRVKTVSGTSCSSPIFAAVIALLNDELLNAGKPVLGFLNPWLYANPHAFNDIQTGNNPGCGTP
jgi:hypothetical protein